MKVPMLDEEEYSLCHEANTGGKELVIREAKKRGIHYTNWVGKIAKPQEMMHKRHFIDMYRMLTGFEETNANAIMHHVLDMYGPECPKCTKPLRTKTARYCVECGFGKEDFTSEHTPPLTARKPELFD